MHSKPLMRVALAATLTGLVPLASAQELPLRTTLVEDRIVVMMDQMGWDRGIGVVLADNPLDDESTVNPDGDYTGRMNGTSAAAATVTGFGAVDLDAAVEMAEVYTPDSLGEFRETSWFEQTTSIAIPDDNGTGVTQTVSVNGLPDDATIEAVLLEVDISHEFPNDLGIHLISPGGTRSVVNQVYNETLAVEDLPRGASGGGR